MGCVSLVCGKEPYNYGQQERLLLNILPQFSNLNKCYTHDFVIKCHKNLLSNPEAFLLKYEKKVEQKQVIPHTVIQKWKLILYGTNIQNEHYIDCLGFDKQVEQQRISAKKTYRFSRDNPFQIKIQDLYPHQSYKQIQKDANRVFHVPQIKQDLFQKVLKKIANHFPQSGYSLGINYIVGYFLLIGMSQIDSFWMFVHLALNEKFLALGFYQNSLPLTKIIIQIFKNILRRKNRDLYKHLISIQLNDQSWILKWIISFYLSIFPIQFCHYLWDYILTFGILGLAIIAFTIVNQLQSFIFKCEDQAEFNITINQIFSAKAFKKEIEIQKLMKSVYSIFLEFQDFQGLETFEPTFYTKYFILYSEWRYKGKKKKRQQLDQLVSQWYQYVVSKRQSFTNLAKSSGNKFFPQTKILDQIAQIKQNHDQIQIKIDLPKNEQIIQHQSIPKADEIDYVSQQSKIIEKQLSTPGPNQLKYTNPKTIKISSHRWKNQNGSLQQSKKIQSEQDEVSHFSFVQNFKSQKFISETLIRNQKKTSRKAKSDFLIYEKYSQTKSKNKQNLACSIKLFQSKKQVSSTEYLNELNEKIINRQFSLQLMNIGLKYSERGKQKNHMKTFAQHFFSNNLQKSDPQAKQKQSEDQIKESKQNKIKSTKIQDLQQNYALNQFFSQKEENIQIQKNHFQILTGHVTEDLLNEKNDFL